MRAPVYALLVACALPTAACKRRNIADLPDEQGKLSRMAAKLEEAYATMPLPPVTEPASLRDRLETWDDFRTCAVRAYVARRRDRDQALRENRPRPSRHASIGDEAVEECAVLATIEKKDRSYCERLAVDYAGPTPALPSPALRCWDTRARVFGTPDECPVFGWGGDIPARNPECLAFARRDASLCFFAENPIRCRAIIAGEVEACGGGPADCTAAVAYWKGMAPPGIGAPLFEERTLAGSDGPTFELEVFLSDENTGTRLVAKPKTMFVSMPAGKTKPPHLVDDSGLWGPLPSAAAATLVLVGHPSARLAFTPTAGPQPLSPPGPEATSTLVLLWPDRDGFRRCAPGPETKGSVTVTENGAAPGTFVSGSIEAEHLRCTDGKLATARGRWKAAILDLR